MVSCLKKLKEIGVERVMLEGGAKMISAAFSKELVDEICFTMSGHILGGLPLVNYPLASLIHLHEHQSWSLGTDLWVHGAVCYDPDCSHLTCELSH